MPVRPIVLLGDPLLRTVSKPLQEPTSALPILRDLADTLAGFRRTHGFGRGISAIQIGEPFRVIYMDVDGVKYEMVNPEYIWKSGETFELWDDCFSFPNLMVWLERSRAVRLRYRTPAGALTDLEAEDSLAELIQHEMDHLDGVLALDHARSSRHLALREVVKANKLPPFA